MFVLIRHGGQKGAFCPVKTNGPIRMEQKKQFFDRGVGADKDFLKDFWTESISQT